MADHALVTGGAGFIGLALCRRLLADGYDVTVLDDLSRHGMDPEFGELIHDVRFIERDVSSGMAGITAARGGVVFHLAAWVGVERVTHQPYRVLRDNILATVAILDWSADQDVSSVFLSSTSEIADGAAELDLADVPVPLDAPFALARPYAPRASYALSKAVAESLLMYRAPSFQVRIGRFHNVYGPRMGNAHVIPQFIERLLARLDPFPIYGAEHSRAFCYVSDAVDAVMQLMALPGSQPVVANIGNDEEELTMRELADRLFAIAGYSARLEVRKSPPGSPLRRRPDLSVLRELTGYRPQITLNEGLARTYEWYERRAASGCR